MIELEKEDQTAGSVIVAAGGILERTASEGPLIAIIRRQRYGDEWAFPKGKVKSGESWAQAAIREVEEETGFSVSVREFAGVSHYDVEGSHKVVVYWLMAPTDGAFTASDEVKELVWVTPEVAQDRLTHRDQRELLQRVYGTAAPSTEMNLLQRSWARLLRLVSRRKYLRLVSEVETYRKELLYLRSERSNERLTASLQLLAEANDAAFRGLLDKGWRRLHAAVRMETLALDAKTDKYRLQARVAKLRQEIGKIGRWRERAADKLLREGEYLPPVDHIYQAMLLRDEHYANQAYKGSLLRHHVAILLLVLVGLLAILLRAVYAEGGVLRIPFNADDIANPEPQVFVGAVLFGLLGGTLSAVFKAPRNAADSRIPELVSTVRLTMLRLVAGAGTAILVVTAARGGLLDIFDPQVAGTAEGGSFFGLYTIAFAAGFSERLVLKAAESWAAK